MTIPVAPPVQVEPRPRAVRRTAIIVVLAVVLPLGAVGLAGFALFTRGCSGADRALLAPLASDPMLALAPAGTTAEASVYVGPCDEDEEYAWAGRSLDFHGSEAAVVDFYVAEAASRGWTRPPSTRDDPPALCLSRPLDGTTAYLTVEVDGPDEGVSLAADADGPIGC